MLKIFHTKLNMLRWGLAVFFFVAAVGAASLRDLYDEVHEDASLNMIELLTKYGYPSENHTVTTEDGYLLTLYRIPYGKKCGPDQIRKPPVLLQHGLLSNSIDFINSGVENGLGYILADECYDVWLGNNRGNFESKRHVSLSPDEDAFWKFSWHEFGQYDLPAFIEYILETTGQPRLHYCGHSQGTTQFFVYSSLYPEESAEKVISMHALAPIAFMENMTSPLLRWQAKNIDKLEMLFNLLGWNQFLPKSDVVSSLGGNMCTDDHPNMEHLCENVLFILCGYDSQQLNDSMLPIISANDPAGASTRQVMHYGQEINSAEFRQYDHGTVENLIRYGSIHPPKYAIEKIQVPLYLHYGDNDWMASLLDVERFAAAVPKAFMRQVPFEKFNHLDFLWAIDVRELLYNSIVEQLNKDSL